MPKLTPKLLALFLVTEHKSTLYCGRKACKLINIQTLLQNIVIDALIRNSNINFKGAYENTKSKTNLAGRDRRITGFGCSRWRNCQPGFGR
jgi:hypothetical protein